MTYSIRTMTAEDIDVVLELAGRSSGASQWPRRLYEEVVGQRQSIALVAAEGSAMCGFAIAKIVLEIAELESIVVEENFRRQGIGAALLQSVLARSRAQGAERVELEVRAGNRAAISLYERAGFTRDGLRRGYYQHPQEDALLMSRMLDFLTVPVEKNP